jgi:hypothetical protein
MFQTAHNLPFLLGVKMAPFFYFQKRMASLFKIVKQEKLLRE